MKESRLKALRNAGWVVLALLLLAGAGMLGARLLRNEGVPQRRAITTVMKVVLPPPPPPPPPPQQPPPQPQKMLEQPKVTTPEAPKPAQAKPSPQKSAPSAVPRPPGNPLTAEAGPGANPYGLAVGNGGGDTIGGGGGGGGGSRFGYYAGLIQSQIQAALQRDEKTRYGRYGLMVRVWLGPSGQVTRASLVGSTGNATLDGAIARVLGSLAIGEAPPQDMPQPVNLRISTQG
jgi:outer membrane biosynthesis protein TonB